MKNTYGDSTMKEAREALRVFVEAAVDLSEKWHDLLNLGYPDDILPDFEELSLRLQSWEGETAERMENEPLDDSDN